MKRLTLIALAAGSLAGVALSAAVPTSAMAQGFSFSFDTGNVAAAYSDGYWDHNHRWHRWHSAREAREYRARFAPRYYHMPRYRAPNMGWRDEDRDGVPNRYDRDRDGDGTPNRADRRPDNPFRR